MGDRVVTGIKTQELKVSGGQSVISFIFQLLAIVVIAIVVMAILVALFIVFNPITMYLMVSGIVPVANMAWALMWISIALGVGAVITGIVLVIGMDIAEEGMNHKQQYGYH